MSANSDADAKNNCPVCRTHVYAPINIALTIIMFFIAVSIPVASNLKM